MSLTIKRFISFLFGLFILSLGVSFTILSRLGAGAWDALSVGLAQLTGFTVGTWVILIGVILIFVNALILKKRPDLLSIVTALILGYFIDLWLLFIFPNFMPATVLIQVVVLGLGVTLMGFGIATYLQAKFTIVPIDGFMVAIQKRFNVNLMTGKTIGEVTALIFAFIAGGPIGVGTIVVTLSIGPMVQLFFPYVERIVYGYH
ncbi:membrane protein [Anaerobacillus alkalilacustris]|uniref:Membrane protein n=1 Tax=Anaerobacillus alkalilacustris TaxID=393763 RepID=A0A1S2LM11_9BACI|nr:YitT family protein [Anaerobacillus alkalilacustris]OIJ13568.1 membrane protein [Anaerobacillus alkalilacustris]